MHFKVLNYSWDRVAYSIATLWTVQQQCYSLIVYVVSVLPFVFFYQLMCAALCVGVVFAHAFLCLFRNLSFIFFGVFFAVRLLSRASMKPHVRRANTRGQTCSPSRGSGAAKVSRHKFLIQLLHVRARTFARERPAFA